MRHINSTIVAIISKIFQTYSFNYPTVVLFKCVEWHTLFIGPFVWPNVKGRPAQTPCGIRALNTKTELHIMHIRSNCQHEYQCLFSLCALNAMILLCTLNALRTVEYF